MGQFGLHASIGLFISSLLIPNYNASSRYSFIFGFYWGCVFPDLDVYPEAIALFINSNVSMRLHRTYLHSLITGFFLCLLFQVIEIIRSRCSNFEASKEPLISPRTTRISFSSLGIGLFCGFCVHVIIDIIIWFSPVEITWPLPDFGIGNAVNIWENFSVSEITTKLLTISEILFMDFFFSALFFICRARWTHLLNSSDNNSISVLTFNRCLKALIVLIILHSIYFLVLIVIACTTGTSIVFLCTFSCLLIVSIPSFYILSWKLRYLIIYKQ